MSAGGYGRRTRARRLSCQTPLDLAPAHGNRSPFVSAAAAAAAAAGLSMRPGLGGLGHGGQTGDGRGGRPVGQHIAPASPRPAAWPPSPHESCDSDLLTVPFNTLKMFEERLTPPKKIYF